MSPRPFILANKSGAGGAQGFGYLKSKKGEAHAILIAFSTLFTTPLATGAPFHWKDFTPLARLALDEFILWVNADSPHRSAREYVEAVKKVPGKFKMGGVGATQEDRIVTLQLEQALGLKFGYVPFKAGSELCAALAGKQVDSTVNNPSECVGPWKSGRVKPLAVFDASRITWAPEWKEIPTAGEALGTDIRYLMLRGFFGPPAMPKEASAWFVNLLRQISETKEFQDYLRKNAVKPAWLSGPAFVQWLGEAEKRHEELMRKGGLLQK
jgi:putative tricarboxylic transport membrane protein